MQLSTLTEGLGARIVYAKEEWDREIHSLSTDSKKESPSALFFCLSGGERDGHTYAKESVQKGAVAVVVERELSVDVPQILVTDTRETLAKLASRFYGDPTRYLKVVGVTGTNGKTTTTYMLESIAKEAGKKAGVIGTLGIRYCGREEDSDLTTPDPIALQEAFAKMLRCGVEYVFMEVSAHALYYKKTAGVRFWGCIFTNLTQDHLDFFPNMQAYRESKFSLFNEGVCPLAIVNGDEEAGRAIGELRAEGEGKTLYYGLNSPADAFAILTDESLQGTECMLNVNDKLCRVTLSMLGRHNVYNALAAATCGVELGFSTLAIARGLTKLAKVEGRLEKVANFHGGKIYVDFAHTPDGLKKSLQALKLHCKGRLLCLFGCGGNRDTSKRPLMGEIAAKHSDFAILTSDNPRYEDPMDILSQVEIGYRRFSSRYVVVPDRKRAIGYALSFLQEGDILLIAGKGGEHTQEIMGIKYPFNDHDVVRTFLDNNI